MNMRWKKLWLLLFSEYNCMADPDGEIIVFTRKPPAQTGQQEDL